MELDGRLGDLPPTDGRTESRAHPKRSEVTHIPFLGNLATAAAWAKSSSPQTTWQIFRKRVCCGHAAGHFIGSQGASRATGPAGLQWVSPQRALRLALSIAGDVWRNGQTFLRHAESRTNWENEGI